MELTVNIGNLVDAVSQCSITLDRKGLAANMYFKAVAKEEESGWLYLYSTNLTAETLTKIPAKVKTSGDILLDPAKLLGGLTGRPTEDEIELVMATKNKLKVTYNGSGKFHLAASTDVGILADKMKKLPFKTPAFYEMKGSQLAEFVRRCMFCIPPESNDPNLQIDCLHLTDNKAGFEAQATDGQIIAQITMAVTNIDTTKSLGSIKLPHAALQPLKTMLFKRQEDIVKLVREGESKVFFRFGDSMYGTLLIAGSYPDLKPLLAGHKGTHGFKVNRDQLKASLGRANVFVDKKNPYVVLELLKDKRITVKVGGSLGDFVDHLPVESEDVPGEEAVKIGVALDYLSNITSNSKSEFLDMYLTNPKHPLIVTDAGESANSKYIVAGVRLT